MVQVQLELDFLITELQLRAQPSTLSEVREQRTTTVTTTIVVVDSAVADYMQLFEQSFEVQTTLQEDPNVEPLETVVGELQQRYDEVKGTTHMIALT